MKGIGILPGPRAQYIDHLVPLCHLMEIPLLVTDPIVHDLIERYYPPLDLRLVESEDYLLDEALEGYDLFFYVEFSRCGNGSFQFHEYVTKSKARSVISLHGNPDKFREIYWIERLADEDVVLAYGPQLLELFQKKGVNKIPIISGNYRLEYYKAHQAFFDAKLPFEKEKQTILYAPTWTSMNRKSELRMNYSSFFDVYREVFERLPEAFQLVVKLHPNLIRFMSSEVEKIKQAYPHIHFIDDYPTIFPLLNQIDLYLGDYSSIGYDFLYFDRPLFFLKTKEKTPLQSSGICIEEEIYETIAKNMEAPLSEKRQQLYRHAYGDSKPLAQLKEEIEQCVSI